MESFLEGFGFGIGAAVPLGPINILIMNSALERYSAGVGVGLGAMSADISYLLLILLGLFGFAKNPSLGVILALASSIVLLYFAWKIFAGRKVSKRVGKISPDKKVSSMAHGWSKGYLLTLLNPYTIIFWSTLSTYIATANLDIFPTVAGVVCAITLWITMMPLVVYRSRNLISEKMEEYFAILSASILLFFALAMALRIPRML